MESSSSVCFSSFIEQFGIKNDVPFNNCRVKGVKFHKKTKIMEITLVSEDILLEEMISTIKKQIKTKLDLSKVDINIICTKEFKELKELITCNWSNVVYILNKMLPFTKSVTSQIDWQIRDNKFYIIFKEQLIFDKAKERSLQDKLENFFISRFNYKLFCVFETEIEHESELCYEEAKIIEENKYLAQVRNEIKDFEIKGDKNPQNKIKVIMGKNFKGEPSNIEDIYNDSGNVIIEGEVFSIEIKKLNSGKMLCILYVTDFTNSIVTKIFQPHNKDINFDDCFFNGQQLRLKGNIVFDKYLKENILMVSDIVNIPKITRMDESEEKRVELHLHTQMSAMDGISPTAELVKQAALWGHKAIAITDHGVVQAFPEAMEAAKRYDIKVIYGIEGYLVDDTSKATNIDGNYSLDEEFIVFDIETTGLSNKHNKITEIGAVKIKNSEIIDTYSTLVNPETIIPDMIVSLTGITNEMVKDAPRISEVLPSFLAFIKDRCLVAHNAEFDVGFIRESCNHYGYKLENPVLDTLKISRVLLSHLKKHKLNIVAQELQVNLDNHHRAINDAKATAEIFKKFIGMLKEKAIYNLKDINKLFEKNVDYKKLRTNHVILLAQNGEGLKNLYTLVSESHMNYFYKKPRIPKSLLDKYREGIIVGSACESGEVFQALLKTKSPEEIHSIVAYYDYLEIQPISNNEFLINKNVVKGIEDIKKINLDIIELGERHSKPVVATGDVHFLNPRDGAYRKILMAGQGYDDVDNQPPLYLKTTEEMLKEFSYLGADKAFEVVVKNPNFINSKIDSLLPIPKGTFPPIIEGSEDDLRRLCFKKSHDIYGETLPEIVMARLEKELNSIISNGYAVMYIIAHKLVTKSMEDGYLVGSRGSVGSSFAATMSDITEVNPLPPHYICSECKYSLFFTDGSYGSGADLPDEKCPHCSAVLIKEGHDIPFEVFLGFEGDKEPDIDLNFAGEYQSEAHKYTEELFGKGKVYRAGTIGTIAEKTAYGFVKKYIDENQKFLTNAEINRLTKGCTGVKKTSGQHPGGVMIVPANKDIYDFCPIQYPANDSKSGVITTHFDYHAISGRLLKLDILGHDVPTIIRMLEDITKTDATKIPLDDQETMSLFTGVDALGITKEDFGYGVGTLGIPEFGTKFVRQMLMDTKPTTFAELVRISGLSHGTDVWVNNAQDLVRSNTAKLKDVISTRDDIMNYLILKGLPAKHSFKIMENVRKGKGLSVEDENIMNEHNVPRWYIDSCNKIKYMFPKAHAVAYVTMSFRIAYYKVHHPEAFYATYFTTKAEDFDVELIIKGMEEVKSAISELEKKGIQTTAKEKNLLTILEVVLEMFMRGIKLMPIDLYNSDADKFLIKEGQLLPPLKSLQGVGENAAKNIVKARDEGNFLSIENFRQRTKTSKTVIEKLVNHGCLQDLPDTNQLSFF